MQIKEQIEEMENLWGKNKKDEAFLLFTQNLPNLQSCLLWMETEQVLAAKDFEQLMGYLYQAIENKDHILLEDVMYYGIRDIITQLLGLEEVERGEPFCGPAGKNLRYLIEQCGLDRSTDFLITNALPFRTFSNGCFR